MRPSAKAEPANMEKEMAATAVRARSFMRKPSGFGEVAVRSMIGEKRYWPPGPRLPRLGMAATGIPTGASDPN
jgi:hypothetical protein